MIFLPFQICTKLMSYVTLIIFAAGNASWILWALHFIYCSSFLDVYMHLLLYKIRKRINFAIFCEKF